LAAVVLTMANAAPGLAQEQAAADDMQRVEVGEAGVAAAFPSTWDARVEMRERGDWGLYDEGFAQEPVVFWNVIYASAGGRPWCDLVWYPSHPLPMAAHVERYEALMRPTGVGVERSIEVEPLSLPAGTAYRFVIYNGPTDDYTTTYLLGGDDQRYLLQCVDDERAADDWLAVAESLELLEPTAGSDAGN
jgi:hypothetical protein